MSQKAGIRGFNKVMRRCPSCGGGRPKELVESRRFRPLLYGFLGAFSCGLLLLVPWLFYADRLMAYCDDCDDVFDYR